MARRPGSGSWPLGSPRPPGPQRPVPGPVGGRAPQGRGGGAEQHHRRGAQGGGQVGDAGVAAHDPVGGGDQAADGQHAALAGVDGAGGQPGPGGDVVGQVDLVRAAGHDHPPAGGQLGPGDLGEPLGRPAPGRAGRARVDEGGARGPVGHRAGRQLQVEPARVGGDAALLQQPAPAGHLVLVGPPAGALGAGRHRRVGERDQPPRLGGQQQVVALGAAAVQVHGQPGAVQAPVQGLGEPVGRDHLVDRARGAGQRGQHGRGGQQARVPWKGVGEGAQGRDRGEQVAQAEGAEHHHGRAPVVHRGVGGGHLVTTSFLDRMVEQDRTQGRPWGRSTSVPGTVQR